MIRRFVRAELYVRQKYTLVIQYSGIWRYCMKQHKDLTTLRFGRWLVLGEGKHKYSGNHRVLYWKCQCDCGTLKEVTGNNLTYGKSKSCGCLHYEEHTKRQTTHGMSKTSIYSIWSGMINRCYNEKSSDWYLYGGRGVKVCKQWKCNFQNFFADMGSTYKEGLAIDRKDTNWNYEPSNCRWATQKQQQRNRRNNRNLTFKGKTMCIAAWAEEIGIKISTLGMRLQNGWSIERALITKVRKQRVTI